MVPSSCSCTGNPRGPIYTATSSRVLVDAGLRVIAPDLIGFGRSDKPTERTDYTFARHIDWVHCLIRSLDLTEVTLVVQDWGGPIGLSVLAREPDRFARVLATNTILHTCDPALAGKLGWAHHGVGDGRVLLQETLLDYVLFYLRSPDIVPSFFLNAVAGPLSADVLAAYDAPFPDRSFKAGLRQLTALIPLTRNDPGAAIGRATMAVLRGVATAVPDGLLRRGPRNQGLGDGVPGTDPRRANRKTTRP